MATVELRKQREAEETERQLNDKVQSATVEQLTHKFDQDFEVLKGRIPGPGQIAKEAALDAKYLADRQLILGLNIRPKNPIAMPTCSCEPCYVCLTLLYLPNFLQPKRQGRRKLTPKNTWRSIAKS